MPEPNVHLSSTAHGRRELVNDRGVWRWPHDANSDRWGMVYRVWFRSHTRGEVYFDVEAWGHPAGAGYDALANAYGTAGGWWLDRWQWMAALVGAPGRWKKDTQRRISGPPLKRRVIVAVRRTFRRLKGRSA